MPVDYSKWDKLELSDDEDFECHPNVDKKSMIRWKQAQIHKQRRERSDQQELLKKEMETNERYLEFVGAKMEEFEGKSGAQVLVMLDAMAKQVDRDFTDPMRQDSLSRMNSWTFPDPPDWGNVLKLHKPWNELIMDIGKSLEEEVKKSGLDSSSLSELIKSKFADSNQTVVARQKVLREELKRLELENSKKITTDDLHTGFDKTILSEKPKEVAATSAKGSSASKPSSSTETTEETIHTPETLKFSPEIVELIFSELESTDQDLQSKHPQLLQISKTSDYAQIFNILKSNPDLMSNEALEEALLLRALCLEIVNERKLAKNSVMVSLIMKFTRSLGVQGLEVFFNKLTGTGTAAQNLFFTDLETTYKHITTRAQVLRAEKLSLEKEHRERLANRRSLYEKFKQPDGTLKLPASEPPTPAELKQKEWFDCLPEYYKEGLLLEDVDKINRYLGSLDPEEADYQSKIACKAGFLSLQEDEQE